MLDLHLGQECGAFRTRLSRTNMLPILRNASETRDGMGRFLTLPTQHKTSPRDRTASRPRLAARSTAQVALNLFTRAIAFGAAASRGRLAVRWQCEDAPLSKSGQGRGEDGGAHLTFSLS